MAEVRFNGTSKLTVNGYTFMKGVPVEVRDVDLWNMLKLKTFKWRLENGQILIPRDFPLEKPKALVEVSENEEESETSPLMGTKATLRAIMESNDPEFLNKILLTDSRDKVKEAATRRLQIISEV